MTTTTSRLARTAAMLTTVLATMAAALVMLGATAAPAQAAYDPSARFGYTKDVIEKEAYLRQPVSRGVEVLHVDTEHAAVDGFWYATRSALSSRGFMWTFQPYGMWCGDSSQKVEWNGWMNTTRCGYDFPRAESEFPGITQRTDACRAASGHPWKDGSPFAGDTNCGNSYLSPGGSVTFQEGATAFTCAPWEDQGATPSGGSKCLTQRYAWESATPNSFWTPAPDTCTGLPANANLVPTNPDAYVPAGPVPDCTGAALASNCPVGSTHQACTGVAERIYWGTSTVTSTVTDGAATATATKSAQHKAVAYKVTKTAKATYKGKVYKAKRTVKVYGTATKTVSVTVTLTDGKASRTSTMSCSATAQAAAQACADAKAVAEAGTQARTAAESEAMGRAKTAAAAQAATQAADAAERSANGSTVSKSEKKAAAKKAKKQAVKAVQKAIAKAKRS